MVHVNRSQSILTISVASFLSNKSFLRHLVTVFPKVHVGNDQDQTILTMNIIPVVNKITWLPGLRELGSRNLIISEVLMYCESYVSVKINSF